MTYRSQELTAALAIADHGPHDNGAAAPDAPATRQRLVPIHWKDLHLLPKRECLIEGVLDVGAMSTLLGATGSCKTAIAIDLGGHVAVGMNWRGKRVRRGTVLYVAAEGGQGIGDRLKAWRQHHRVDVDEGCFYVIPEPIDLAHGDADVGLLVHRIKELGHVDFLLVDTYSRALAGGDENSPKDAGSAIHNCDLIRHQVPGLHLCLLHHPGKDETRGARGHSLFKAAMDTELTITKSGQLGTIEITKQRDGPIGARWGFAIELVDFDDGNQSFVVVAADAPPAGTPRRAGLSPKYELARRTLADLLDEQGEPVPSTWALAGDVRAVATDAWNSALLRAGILDRADKDVRKRFWDIKRALKLKGITMERDGRVWLTSPPERLEVRPSLPAPNKGRADRTGRGDPSDIRTHSDADRTCRTPPGADEFDPSVLNEAPLGPKAVPDAPPVLRRDRA